MKKMKMMNYKIFLAVSLLLLLASCSDEVSVGYSGSSDTNDGYIHFSTETAATKTIIDGSTVSSGDAFFSVEASPMQDTCYSRGTLIDNVSNLKSFGVFAYETTGNFHDNSIISPSILLFDNQEVSVDAADGSVCSYLPLKYWPSNTDNITFLAYAPYVSRTGTNPYGLTLGTKTDALFNAVENNVVITYKIPEQNANQPDLMIADIVKDQTTAANGQSKVLENFQHALSAIGFRIKGNGKKIKSIKVANVLSKGELTICDEKTYPNYKFGWNLEASVDTFALGMTFDSGMDYYTLQDDNNYTNITLTNGYLMMLPQELSANAQIILTYIDEDNKEKIKSYTLKDSGVTTWAAGMKYMYNISLSSVIFEIKATPSEFEYNGGFQTYSVTSKVTRQGATAPEFAAWTADFVDDDGNVIAKPSWMTIAMKAETGTPDSTNYTAIAETQDSVLIASQRDLNIRSKAEKTSYYDLSSSETANCYVVNAAGKYKFRADVMGNGTQGLVAGGLAYDYLGNTSTNASIDLANASAKIIWMDSKNAVKNVVLNGNYIQFETAPQSDIMQANALIAVMKNNVIMWSWHIWITDTNTASNTATFDGKTILDAPLGYVFENYEYKERKINVRFTQNDPNGESVTVTFVQKPHIVERHNYLYYEWGRKDPFVGVYGVVAGNGGWRDYVDGNNNPLEFKYAFYNLTDPTAVHNDYSRSIREPQIYYYGDHYSWNKDLESWDINAPGYDVWGAKSKKKTIYDPSPAGYRVPDYNTFDYFKSVTPVIVNGGANLNYGSGTLFTPFCGLLYGRKTYPFISVYGAEGCFMLNQKTMKTETSVYFYNRWNFHTDINKNISIATGQSQVHGAGIYSLKIQ